MKEQSKGALLMAISAVFFSIGGVLIKMIPWGALATNGGRCIFGVIVYGIYLIIAKKKLVFNGPTLLGALGIMGTTFFFNTATKCHYFGVYLSDLYCADALSFLSQKTL